MSSAAIYVRVSTADQSVESQLRDLREFCASRGFQCVPEYSDAGISGKTDSRPAWNQCWDAIQKGKHDMLIVHALDRIGRSLPHLVGILEYLREHNVALVSYRENIDLSSSTGKMLAGIFALMAEYERNIISERTKAGLRAARAGGKRLGRPFSTFDREKARDMLINRRWGQLKTGKALGVSVATIHKYRKILEKDGLLPPTGYLTKGVKIGSTKAANLTRN